MKHVIAPALLCIALGFSSGCSPTKDQEPPKPQVTAAAMALPNIGLAPSWELKDVDGNVVRSDQFKGKVLVVDFWATWCGPCKIEIPGYIELTKKYGNDLAIVGISYDQAGPEVVKDFVAKNGINYPIVMFDEKVIEAFGGLEAIPTTFLIDRTGKIRDKKIGAMATVEYEKKILAVMGGER